MCSHISAGKPSSRATPLNKINLCNSSLSLMLPPSLPSPSSSALKKANSTTFRGTLSARLTKKFSFYKLFSTSEPALPWQSRSQSSPSPSPPPSLSPSTTTTITISSSLSSSSSLSILPSSLSLNLLRCALNGTKSATGSSLSFQELHDDCPINHHPKVSTKAMELEALIMQYPEYTLRLTLTPQLCF